MPGYGLKPATAGMDPGGRLHRVAGAVGVL